MPSLKNPNTVVQSGSGRLSSGVDGASVLAAVNSISAHINDPSRAHPAVAINTAAGPTWLNGRTNPAATVQAQLDKIVNDLADRSVGDDGAERVGLAPRSTWLGGRTNPGSDVWTGIEKIINDLSDTASGDDGVERIGAKEVTGSPTSLSLGSAKSQIGELLTALNARARIASAESITGNWTFGTDGTGVTFLQQPFGPIGSGGGVVFWRCSGVLANSDQSIGPTNAADKGFDEYIAPVATANRVLTFTAYDVDVAMRVRVVRLGTEAFDITVKQNGGTSIAKINAGSAGWMEFIFRSTNWHLSAWGGGVTILLAT